MRLLLEATGTPIGPGAQPDWAASARGGCVTNQAGISADTLARANTEISRIYGETGVSRKLGGYDC